jgi:hypothetical protein
MAAGQPAYRTTPGPLPVRQRGADRYPQQRMVRGAAEQHEEPVYAVQPGPSPAAALAAPGGGMPADCTHAFMIGARTSLS